MPGRFYTYLMGVALTAIGDAILYILLPFMAMSGGAAREADIALIVGVGSATRLSAPLVGRWVDAYGPARVIYAAAFTRLLVFGCVALVRPSGLAPVLALAAVNGLLSAAVTTSGSAGLPSLVPADRLGRANALNAVALMGLPIAGYAAAGVLISTQGIYVAVLVAVIAGLPLFIAGRALPARNHIDELRDGPEASSGRFPGWLFVLGGCALLINCCVNISNVRAPLHFNAIGEGAQGYGNFEAVLGLGVIAGLAVGATLAKRHSSPLVITASLAIGGGSLMTALPHGWAWPAFGAMLGFGMGCGQVVCATFVQQHSVRNRIGRNMGLLTALGAVGLMTGSVVAGLSVATSVLLLGVATPLVCLACMFLLVGGRSAIAEAS